MIAYALGIPRSTLYYDNKSSEEHDLKLKVQIEKVLNEHKFYGYRRIANDLHFNHKQVQRIMQKYEIRGKSAD